MTDWLIVAGIMVAFLLVCWLAQRAWDNWVLKRRMNNKL